MFLIVPLVGLGCAGPAPISIVTVPPTPADTGDTDDTDVAPPTVEPFGLSITLTDGDQADDSTNPQDADTITVTISNSSVHYPDVVEWWFGFAETERGPDFGWFGEDCNGVISTDRDICHAMAPDSTMVLERIFDPELIQPGHTTLLRVDFPESDTPANSYVLIGLSDIGEELVCLTTGHQPAYYMGFGCVMIAP